MTLLISTTLSGTAVTASTKPSRPATPIVAAAADAGDGRWSVTASGWAPEAIGQYRMADGAGGWTAWRPLTQVTPYGATDPALRYSLYRDSAAGLGANVGLQIRQSVNGRSSQPSPTFYAPEGVATRGAPRLLSSIPDQTLTISAPEATINLRTIFDTDGALPMRFSVLEGPASTTIDSDGVTLRIGTSETIDAQSVVIRADNRVVDGADGYPAGTADGYAPGIGGIRDAAFTLTIAKAATDGTLLAGLDIYASRTMVDGFEGVVFKATGVSDRTLRLAEFSWDFGSEESRLTAAPDAGFRGQREMRFARGAIVGHVFQNASGALAERTVTLTARIGGELAVRSIPIEVHDPDVTYAGIATLYVGDPVRYATREDFQIAAEAGLVEGVRGSQNLPLENYWLKPVDAIVFARNNASPRRRILMQRGAVWTIDPAEPSYDPHDIGQIGAFGVGKRPVLATAPVGQPVPGSLFSMIGDGAPLSLWGFEVRGTYDPANPNRSDLGVFDYASEMTAFRIGAGQFINRDMTLHDLKVSGVEDGISSSGVQRLVVSEVDIGNWRNYGLRGSYRDSVIVGSRIKQPLDTQYKLDGNHGKNANSTNQPNWSGHGPVRIGAGYGVGIHQNDIRSRGGWSGGVQPAIRAGVVYAQSMTEAAQFWVEGVRQHFSIAGNHIDTPTSAINFAYENTENVMVPARALVSEANYIQLERASSGAYGVENGNAVIRNDFIYAPNWDAGDKSVSYAIIGGSGDVVLWTPSGTLDDLEDVRMLNVTVKSEAQTSGVIVGPASPLYYHTLPDAGRISFTRYAERQAEFDPYIPETLVKGPFADQNDPDWIALKSWVDTNWPAMKAAGEFTLGVMPRERMIVRNVLFEFSESSFSNKLDYDASTSLTSLGQPTETVTSDVVDEFAPRLDLRGARRPTPPTIGALEPATDLSDWAALPRYAAPVIEARWTDAAGAPVEPGNGDVFGVDFFAEARVLDAGTPALEPENVILTAEIASGADYSPLTEGAAVATADLLRLRAEAPFHPHSHVRAEITTTVPAIADLFAAAAVRLDGNRIVDFSPALGATGRAFTVALAFRSHDLATEQNILRDLGTVRTPRLRLSGWNPTSGQAAWFFDDAIITNGTSAQTQRFVASPDFHRLGQTEFIVFTGRFGADHVATFELWRNGQLILTSSRQGTADSRFNWNGLGLFTNGNGSTRARIDVSRFFWMSTTEALDGAAATAALFDVARNEARDLGGDGLVTIGGVARRPTVYLAGSPSAWNSGVNTGSGGGTYVMEGTVATAP